MMKSNSNQARRAVFNLKGIFQYFQRKSMNRSTVRRLRELSPEQLKDIGLSRYDLSHWE